QLSTWSPLVFAGFRAPAATVVVAATAATRQRHSRQEPGTITDPPRTCNRDGRALTITDDFRTTSIPTSPSRSSCSWQPTRFSPSWERDSPKLAGPARGLRRGPLPTRGHLDLHPTGLRPAR